MRAVDTIRRKRDGHALDKAEIDHFVAGATSGAWADYQSSSLLMAIVANGMDSRETAWLTDAMVRSGRRLDWSHLPGPAVDKHSTGGVGDKTSLILAPLVAACGAYVPMMSGRGLGHTGGTLDKLESIPGFKVHLDHREFEDVLTRTGCALIGQTADIAPADKKLYALRDVTGTVESIPLISASIMSKKIAEGIGALVLDVKCGSGAFMKTRADARRLAESLVNIGNANGVRAEALITAMDTPLGNAVGNSLEIIECLETLKGRGPSDLEALSIALAARMLKLAGLATEETEAEALVRRALTSGQGLEKFREIIAAQGGDARVVDDYQRLPQAPNRMTVNADESGYVVGMDAERIGRAAMALGSGRNRVEEAIDPAVGILVTARPGQKVSQGDVLMELLYRDAATLERALPFARHACHVSGSPRPLILDVISETDRTSGTNHHG
jgi:pyrimidine-nucleoside phosphorylase